jgi:diaminopimelate decarboxylase
MNYKVKQTKNTFEVIETKTEHIMGVFSQQSEAKKVLRHLNFGGGFDGFTPTFFVKNTMSKFRVI